MKDQEWDGLVAVIRGERLQALPTGFIIDSPWLPNWAGYSILDYFTSEQIWLAAHQSALSTFPDTWFLPGFWSEFGMCTEPSAFGAVMVWAENEFPFPKRILSSPAEVSRLEVPNPREHGLMPFVIQRLRHVRPEIERSGHKIRMAVARGPLNVASFLMGTTEFLTALKTDAAEMHQLLRLITDFLVEWIAFQRDCFPSIDGLLVLDDLVGFIGKNDFTAFAKPYLERIFSLDVTVKFFHNDAPCRVAAPFLADLGINLLNFGVQHTLSEMREWTQGRVTLLGNLPPRDVLAAGTPEQVQQCTSQLLEGLVDHSRLVVSCGGGMPPGAPSANIRALIDTVTHYRRGG